MNLFAHLFLGVLPPLVSFNHGPGGGAEVAELAVEGLERHLVDGLVVDVQQVLVDEPVTALPAPVKQEFVESRA